MAEWLNGIGNVTLYLIIGFAGFLLGVILSCILLAKKNLAMEKKIEASVENSIRTAKENYKKMTAETGSEPLYYEEEFDESEFYTERCDNDEQNSEEGAD